MFCKMSNIKTLNIEKRFSKLMRIVIPRYYSFFEYDNNNDYFSFINRKIVLLLRSCLPWGYCDSERYMDFFGFPASHKSFYNSWGGIFIDRNALLAERKKILLQVKKNPNYLRSVAENCQILGEKVWKESLKIKELDLSVKSDKELKLLVGKGIEGLVNLSAYLLFPISLQGFFEDSIKSFISHKIKDPKLKNEYFENLTTPSKQNLEYFERVAILKLAVRYNKNKEISQDIEKYIDEFGSLGVKYGIGKLWDKKQVIERVKYLAKQSPQEKLDYILSLPKQADDNVKLVLKRLGADKNFRELVETARLYVYLRTYRANIISGAFANMFPLFEEIGKRNNLDLESVIECLPNEVITFKFPSREIIKKRAKYNIIRSMYGVLYFASGSKAIKIREKLLAYTNKNEKNKTNVLKSDELKGVIANRGIAKGTVKIVTNNTQLKKVNEGDILVSPMTTPDFAPAMEKAAAFVTDEGGILSHAAIVSREMQKPCIIGTQIATKVLKDGDLVEVDANKGVVRKL